jgi:ATP-dependent Lon protease
LPRRNEADLEDVPEDVRKQMKFVLVDTVDEVLAAALPARGETSTGPKAGSKTHDKKRRKKTEGRSKT